VHQAALAVPFLTELAYMLQKICRVWIGRETRGEMSHSKCSTRCVRVRGSNETKSADDFAGSVELHSMIRHHPH